MSELKKQADALARAVQRGDVKINTTKQKLELDKKLQQMTPRNSGNSGLLINKPFASGAEGDAYLAGNRGNGLAVQKVFVGVRPGHEDQYFAKLKTRGVGARARIMELHPDVFPKVYGYFQNSNDPAKGVIDMEYIHGPSMGAAARGGYKRLASVAHKELIDTMNAKGFEYNRANYNPLFRRGNQVVGDIHGGNVILDIKNGMRAKIIDPMYYRADDTGLVGNSSVYLGKTKDRINNPNRNPEMAALMQKDIYKNIPAYDPADLTPSAVPDSKKRLGAIKALKDGDVGGARWALAPKGDELAASSFNGGPVRRPNTSHLLQFANDSEAPAIKKIKDRHFFAGSYRDSLLKMRLNKIRAAMGPASSPIPSNWGLGAATGPASSPIPSNLGLGAAMGPASSPIPSNWGLGAAPSIPNQLSASPVASVAKSNYTPFTLNPGVGASSATSGAAASTAENAASAAHGFNFGNKAKLGLGAAALGALAYGGYKIREAFKNRKNKDA